jgi:hypothetical protein
MPEPRSPSRCAEALIRSAATGARVDRGLQRMRGALQSAASGILGGALSTEELDTLALRLYDLAPGSYKASTGLHAWEGPWYDDAGLPPGGSVLVTAAGSGREVKALLERGFTVTAAEPLPRFAAACAELPGIEQVAVADHAAIAAAILDGDANEASTLRGREFSGVIIGWGSFTHILQADDRVRLLRACDALAPRGPVLISFFGREAAASHPPRAARAGRRLGRSIARRRGITSGAAAGDRLYWHLGFTHAYTAEEIECLAEAVGRDADVTLRPYGHATLRPR